MACIYQLFLLGLFLLMYQIHFLFKLTAWGKATYFWHLFVQGYNWIKPLGGIGSHYIRLLAWLSTSWYKCMSNDQCSISHGVILHLTKVSYQIHSSSQQRTVTGRVFLMSPLYLKDVRLKVNCLSNNYYPLENNS